MRARRPGPAGTSRPALSILLFLFSIEIESTEAQALLDQAHRLFACRFTTRGRTMPVIDPSFVRRPDDALPLPRVASGRGWALAHSGAFRQALAERRFEPNLSIVRALRRRPFALDVYLWDAGYGDCAPSTRSRLARYHALADQPLRAPASATSSPSSASWPLFARSSRVSKRTRTRHVRARPGIEPPDARPSATPSVHC